jgi:hypothetical protein
MSSMGMGLGEAFYPLGIVAAHSCDFAEKISTVVSCAGERAVTTNIAPIPWRW